MQPSTTYVHEFLEDAKLQESRTKGKIRGTRPESRKPLQHQGCWHQSSSIKNHRAFCMCALLCFIEPIPNGSGGHGSRGLLIKGLLTAPHPFTLTTSLALLAPPLPLLAAPECARFTGDWTMLYANSAS